MFRPAMFLLTALIFLFAAPPVRAQGDAAMASFEAGDIKTALRLWEQRARAGDYKAQERLGLVLSGAAAVKGVTPDIERARFWMEKAVAQRALARAAGLDEALFLYAFALEAGVVKGIPGKVSHREKLAWYKLPAALRMLA